MILYEKEKEIIYLKNLIENKLQHTFLDKYVQRPIIEDEKLILLNELLQQHFPTYKKENYIVTIMLIDLALKVHDSVNDGPELPEHMPERVSKQLSVLAGDYYSGLYYLLLSELEDFNMIQTLATAIKVINEKKMELYYHEFSSLDEFKTLVKEIDSLLIVYVTNHIGEHVMGEFLEDWFILNNLYNSRNNSISYQSHLLKNWAVSSSTYSDETLSLYFENNIPTLIKNVENSAYKIPDRYAELKSYIFNKIVDMKRDRAITFRMEEG